MGSHTWTRRSLVTALAWLAGCGAGPNGTTPPTTGTDAGNTGNGTCTPSLELCDGADNDCDGTIDDGFDVDGDGFTTCGGDCDDLNGRTFPGAEEAEFDCDRMGTTDGGTGNGQSMPGDDKDADGYTYPSDCNDRNEAIGPGAVEIVGDGIDNDCNASTSDTTPVTCDPASTASGATDFARSMGICGSFLQSATFLSTAGRYAPASARKIRAKFGDTWLPRQGTNMAHLSSGNALDNNDSSGYRVYLGTQHGVTAPHPKWIQPLCGPQTTVTEAKDMTELKLTLKVPQNANSFSFDFNFFSAEYPYFHCDEYNDRFLALLKTSTFDDNISLDKQGEAISVNNRNFTICTSETYWTTYTCSKSSETTTKLAKTAYRQFVDLPDTSQDRNVGGATDWLTTQAPVTPGETITLRFIILDEGDDKLDSAVLIDNFKWQTFAVDGPTTDPVIE